MLKNFDSRANSLLLVTCLVASALYACGDDDHHDQSPPAGMGGEAPEPVEPPAIVGAGLELSIDSVQVSDAGQAVVEFTIKDSAGNPLDKDGRITLGAVAPSFVLSYLNETEGGESLQYTAYTLRTKTSADGDEAIQSSTDSGGTYETVRLGTYRYTLGSKIDITKKRSGLTHTLGVYATRTYDDLRYVSTALHSWVPEGGDVKTTLDVVTDAACNSCHTRLEFHGGSRRGVGMCNLCHTEKNSMNPESGNTVDFQVMIHKIHLGKDLPSVQEGEPYYFVGYMNSREDFSDVAYPWDMRDCVKCHQGSQGDRWMTRPAEKPCTSCHDRTYFGAGDAPEGWTAHTAGPRDDSECAVCHGEDSLEPISATHYTTLSDPTRPVVTAEIVKIKNTAPGHLPEIELAFEVDGKPHNIVDQPFDRIRMRIWGPNTDMLTGWTETISDAPACGETPVAPCLEALSTTVIYHAALPVPADARGSYQLGLDGRYASTEHGNVAFINPIRAFVISGDLMERREIVDRDKCNSCHGDLAFHGGSYNDPGYCLNCHNGSATMEETELQPGGSELLESLNFKDFIHRKHAGARYPAPLNDCNQCHLDGTNLVPIGQPDLASSLYGVVTCDETSTDCSGGMGGASSGPAPTTTFYEVPPESAACTSCHSDPATVAHAETNTGSVGEACGTCHGPGKLLDASAAHALTP